MTRHEKPTPSPTVSIGMPVYNGEKYIREALDSLLAQIFTNFELIISDNASTDNTEAICREYAARDPRIRHVRQSESRGATANFQPVLDKARGAYFMWAAADNRWDGAWLGCPCETSRSKHGDVIVCATTACLRARLRTAPIRSRERHRADAQLLMTFCLDSGVLWARPQLLRSACACYGQHPPGTIGEPHGKPAYHNNNSDVPTPPPPPPGHYQRLISNALRLAGLCV